MRTLVEIFVESDIRGDFSQSNGNILNFAFYLEGDNEEVFAVSYLL